MVWFYEACARNNVGRWNRLRSKRYSTRKKKRKCWRHLEYVGSIRES